jgi:hypothetical protein
MRSSSSGDSGTKRSWRNTTTSSDGARLRGPAAAAAASYRQQQQQQPPPSPHKASTAAAAAMPLSRQQQQHAHHRSMRPNDYPTSSDRRRASGGGGRGEWRRSQQQKQQKLYRPPPPLHSPQQHHQYHHGGERRLSNNSSGSSSNGNHNNHRPKNISRDGVSLFAAAARRSSQPGGRFFAHEQQQQQQDSQRERPRNSMSSNYQIINFQSATASTMMTTSAPPPPPPLAAAQKYHHHMPLPPLSVTDASSSSFSGGLTPDASTEASSVASLGDTNSHNYNLSAINGNNKASAIPRQIQAAVVTTAAAAKTRTTTMGQRQENENWNDSNWKQQPHQQQHSKAESRGETTAATGDDTTRTTLQPTLTVPAAWAATTAGETTATAAAAAATRQGTTIGEDSTITSRASPRPPASAPRAKSSSSTTNSPVPHKKMLKVRTDAAMFELEAAPRMSSPSLSSSPTTPRTVFGLTTATSTTSFDPSSPTGCGDDVGTTIASRKIIMRSGKISPLPRKKMLKMRAQQQAKEQRLLEQQQGGGASMIIPPAPPLSPTKKSLVRIMADAAENNDTNNYLSNDVVNGRTEMPLLPFSNDETTSMFIIEKQKEVAAAAVAAPLTKAASSSTKKNATQSSTLAATTTTTTSPASSSATTPIASPESSAIAPSMTKPDLALIHVGSRVAVYWDGEDEYFKGTVTKERSGRKTNFFLEYDDGDTEWINFAKATFRLVKKKRMTNKKRRDQQQQAEEQNESSSPLPSLLVTSSPPQEDEPSLELKSPDNNDPLIRDKEEDAPRLASKKSKKLKRLPKNNTALDGKSSLLEEPASKNIDSKEEEKSPSLPPLEEVQEGSDVASVDRVSSKKNKKRESFSDDLGDERLTAERGDVELSLDEIKEKKRLKSATKKARGNSNSTTKMSPLEPVADERSESTTTLEAGNLSKKEKHPLQAVEQPNMLATEPLFSVTDNAETKERMSLQKQQQEESRRQSQLQNEVAVQPQAENSVDSVSIIKSPLISSTEEIVPHSGPAKDDQSRWESFDFDKSMMDVDNWVAAACADQDSSDSETDEEELNQFAANMFGLGADVQASLVAKKKKTKKARKAAKQRELALLAEGGHADCYNNESIGIPAAFFLSDVQIPISEKVKMGRRKRAQPVPLLNAAQVAEPRPVPPTTKTIKIRKRATPSCADGVLSPVTKVAKLCPPQRAVPEVDHERLKIAKEESKRRKEEKRTLTPAEISAILGEDIPCSMAAESQWVRRSSRMPCRSFLESPKVMALIKNLKSNDPDMVILKMKKYISDPAAPTLLIDAALDALEENTNCEALYIQNFNEGMRDAQVRHLIKILQQPSCKIWCLNIGETYKVNRKTWKLFAKGLKKTKITHMYASEHTISGELKDYIRETIRKNRSKHNMHCDPDNLDTIIRCTHCWWNPINTKALRPHINKRGFGHILTDPEAQGLQGTASGATLT